MAAPPAMSADTAPAEMPGEQDRAFNLAARAMQHRFGASGTEEDIEDVLSEFFAPILAEKDEHIAMLQAMVSDSLFSKRQALEARALAAEAVLAAEKQKAFNRVRKFAEQAHDSASSSDRFDDGYRTAMGGIIRALDHIAEINVTLAAIRAQGPDTP
ncbi:MAG: hypothetical protein EOO23_02690 [Comamonadaceae bacterium]|nr:MAG: hypothetical protein EOO23_02690 [Comamonadaceae bacterium]